MKRIIVFCVLALAVIACNKDKVESTPHLKFKSYSRNPLVDTIDQQLRVLMDFTDQEGDLDTVYYSRPRLNKNDPSPDNSFQVLWEIPKFGNQNRGELQINLDLNQDILSGLNSIDIPNSTPRRFETDTILLRFYVKDKAGHTSDTVGKPLYIIRTS